LPNATARRVAALVLFLAAASAPAGAQTLYKWIDADGKTQYSDKPPKKGFTGDVTRIEPEFEKYTPPPPAAPAAQLPEAETAKADPAYVDIAAKRRATRLRLGADLVRARDKVDAARKALALSDTPEPDERQTIQQRSAGGGMHGMTPRTNCRVEVAKDGRKGVMCPTSVPTTEYHERVARLEEKLRKAEEELAAAEMAWRRGVD
jgi:hypothetical protein